MDKEKFPNKIAVEEQKANLAGAKLNYADLTDANLDGANLSDAEDLGGAIGFDRKAPGKKYKYMDDDGNFTMDLGM